MRHISITPVLGVGITDLQPVLDDEVYIQRDYPDGESDQVRMTIAEAYQLRDALAQLLVDGDQPTTHDVGVLMREIDRQAVADLDSHDPTTDVW
ncbi:MAG TPA: hypothetical protein VMV29_09855 [Ktedonobacterales bacterium]|nr:hypothetical protein [Ktedonobacterales bacterium]